MIRAAIFDLDGLLIDSEPLWTRAEIEVFGGVGIELDEDQCKQTVGMGLEEVVEFRYGQRPWGKKSKREVALAIHRRVVELVGREGRPMPGARRAIAFVGELGVKVGLASASDPVLIGTALERLELRDAFDHIQSASELPHGKPHPEVYLRAAERMGVQPGACVALEDSVPGVIAAKAARMKAVAVPERRLLGDPRFAIADVVLESLLELNEDVWSRLVKQE